MKEKTGWPTPRTPPSFCIDWSHGGHLNLFLLLWRICQSAPGLHWLQVLYSISKRYWFNYSPGLKFIRTKCELVQGDLSINNIVIYYFPLSHPPLKDQDGKQPLPQTTWASMATGQTGFTHAPKGVTEDLPDSGIVIDYDYGWKIGTTMEKTSVTLCRFQNCLS